MAAKKPAKRAKAKKAAAPKRRHARPAAIAQPAPAAEQSAEEKNLGGRPPFEPTEDQRKLVQALSGYGIPQDMIVLLILKPNGEPISIDTLQRKFRTELDTGVVKANSRVAESLFKNATDKGNVTAQIFWLKTRAGWKETVVNEHTGKDGGPIQTIDLSNFSDEQLAAIEPLLRLIALGNSAAGTGSGGETA